MLNVTLLAHTRLVYDVTSDCIDDMPYPGVEFHMEIDPTHGFHADTLAEFAGRACYQSFHKPNPATRANKDYIANILKQQHFSVLEHASATFYIQGISRALTHELIRHRHLSYSQLSQRYVPSEEVDFVIPPAVGDSRGLELYLEDYMQGARDAYEHLVQRFEEKGITGKKAREAARAVLPNMTETKIVVTGNHRAWRDVIAKRNSPAADAEIREFASELLRHLKQIAPATYQDME